MNFSSKFNISYQMFRLTGFWGVMTYKPVLKPLFFILSKIGFNLKNRYLKLNLKGYRNPVWFRYGSSDSPLFYQIFVQQEYSCLEDVEEPELIIDCGANVGYSSMYFLNKYPNTHVIAVEPDDENFKVCEKNLFPYSGRTSLIRSAIWSHRTGLSICRKEGNGHEFHDHWAIQVKECRSEQPDIYATDIDNLLDNSEFRSIDILKIDIEGAEAVVFSKHYEKWLSRVKNIVIELHGEECEKEFFKALSMYNYDLSKFGELTICKGISLKAPVSRECV